MRGHIPIANAALMLLRILQGAHTTLFELPGVTDPMRREWIMVRRHEAELRRLERQKFLRLREKGTRLSQVMLTEKGVVAILKAKVRRREKLLPRGQYLVVVFDIPEAHRGARLLLRRFLKEAGFQKIQRSVWIIRRDVRTPLLWLLRIIDVLEWVHLITASRIDGVLASPRK